MPVLASKDELKKIAKLISYFSCQTCDAQAAPVTALWHRELANVVPNDNGITGWAFGRRNDPFARVRFEAMRCYLASLQI